MARNTRTFENFFFLIRLNQTLRTYSRLYRMFLKPKKKNHSFYDSNSSTSDHRTKKMAPTTCQEEFFFFFLYVHIAQNYHRCKFRDSRTTNCFPEKYDNDEFQSTKNRVSKLWIKVKKKKKRFFSLKIILSSPYGRPRFSYGI